jgi:putative endonuclease
VTIQNSNFEIALFISPGGGTGRHAGLKILSAAMRVRVQLPPGARSDREGSLFMSFFVYIIYSANLDRFYTGTTDDVKRRITEHNSNKYPGSFTSRGVPWELFLEIACGSSQQGYKIEKLIKKMRSSVFLRRLKNDPEFLVEILEKNRK